MEFVEGIDLAVVLPYLAIGAVTALIAWRTGRSQEATALIESALALHKRELEEYERLEAKLDLVIAELRHWRDVATLGRLDHVERHGAEPPWYVPFGERQP